MSLTFRKRKLGSRFLEKWSPYLLISVYFLILFYKPVYEWVDSYILQVSPIYDFRDLIALVITVESILFGFLLTVLALTIQSPTNATQHLKSAGRFPHLVKYNKEAIYSCLFVIFISLFLFLSPQKSPDTTYSILWFGFTMLSFLLSLRYVRLFFIIILS